MTSIFCKKLKAGKNDHFIHKSREQELPVTDRKNRKNIEQKWKPYKKMECLNDVRVLPLKT